MKILDISQGVFGAEIYPGDPAPKREVLSSMARGELYNLTALSLSAHTGTHIDAPSHFIADGASVSEISLEASVGWAVVLGFEGVLSEEGARALLSSAEALFSAPPRRLLIRGAAEVSAGAAEVLAESGLCLLGVESQSVGPIEAPMAAHLALLSRGVLLLEGLRLGAVADGLYFLSAAPLLLEGADGAPCRAILIDFEGGGYHEES